MALSLTPARANALPPTTSTLFGNKKPEAPQLRQRSLVDNVVGIGVPVVMSGVMGYASANVAKSMGGKGMSPWVMGAIGAGMTGMFVRGTLNKWGRDASVTNPTDVRTDWKSSALRGAGLGALALGGAATVLIGGRAGMGASLAGKGVVTSLKFAGKAAIPWALAAGAAGAVLGAAAGGTSKSPDAAMGGITHQAVHTSLKWGGIAGGAGAVLAGGLVGLKTHNIKMAGTAAGVAAAAGALFIGQMAFTQSAIWNATSVWANTPKRWDS